MTTLAIGALTATVFEPDGEATHVRDVDRLLRQVADRGLPHRLAVLGLSDGEWCVRRVETSFAYDPDRHQAAAEDDWADALTAALVEALRSAAPVRSADAVLATTGTWSAPVVHYRHRDDAVVDLFTSVTRGSFERTWAWRQLGLVHDAGPWADARAVVLDSLARHPHVALRALRAAVSDPGPAALHRMLGLPGWCALARIIADAAGATGDVVDTLSQTRVPLPSPRLAVDDDSQPGRAADQQPMKPPAPSVMGSARALLALPLLQTLLGGGLRADPAAVRPWALVALADADPAALRRSDAVERIESLACALVDLQAEKPAGLRVTRPPETAAEPTVQVTGDAVAGPTVQVTGDAVAGP
ncbi:MAG TPA: hypothetical protein VIC62_02845, partial [Nakamurella sp.]